MQQKKKKYFGTDGIRARANQGPLDVMQVVRLGEATAQVLYRQCKRQPQVGVGWDTRLSSPALVDALCAGLSSGGACVSRFGVIPTPAVSQLTRYYQLDTGIVVSASHNPAADNGIKYFSADGGKFPDKSETRLEKKVIGSKNRNLKTGVRMGAIQDVSGEAAAVYCDHIIRSFLQARLQDLAVTADLANGATCTTVPRVFKALEIRAQYIADKPDGININANCGSCHLQQIVQQAKRSKAQAAMAFDGDGDRVMLIDERGCVVNGDRILGILALHYAGQGRLPKNTVVATIMSNLGLELFLKARGVRLLRTGVGDRYVAQAMQKQGLDLGGEQAGHILLPHLSPAGDGLVTALEVLAVMRYQGKPLSALAGGWKDFPQMLVNIPVKAKVDLMKVAKVRREVQAAKRRLQERGRVNLRYSGTEALARVMVEAEEAELANTWAHRIGDAVEAGVGSGKRRTATWLNCV